MYFTFLLLYLVIDVTAARGMCRCIPGDSCWPAMHEWAAFNRSIGGKLVATQNLASVCHGLSYDPSKCGIVQSQWYQASFHDESSSSIMSAYVANNSCDAFTSRDTPCRPGNTVAYAVNATGSKDFTAAIRFAKARNLRLVIRNTGHDYMGKSSGKGALSIWTHHMKQMDFLNYTSTGYTGPAVRVGAGVQVEQAYRQASQHGFVLVSGACESVGFAGGYIAGGGHSGMSSKYGLASDQTLEFDVIDGRGQLLKANRKENPDLYWALSGGGAGSYGIVVAVTVKLFPDTYVTAVNFDMPHDPASTDDFYATVQFYRDMIPEITSRGGMSVDTVSDRFSLTPLTLPGLTTAEATELLTPFLTRVNRTSIPYTVKFTESRTYYEHWNRTIRSNPNQLVQNAQYGGWLISRDVVQTRGSALTAAMREIVSAGCFASGIGLNVSTEVDNAVQPGWRDSAIFFLLFTPWPKNADLDEMKARARNMTDICVPALSRLSPDTGTYMNEADPNQQDWQTAFYGDYDRLLSIKKRYDPDRMFYAHTAVGSHEFKIDDVGRLCHLD